MNEKNKQAVSGYLEEDGTKFILEADNGESTFKMTLSPEMLSALSTSFLTLANDSAQMRQKKPSLEEINEINPECIPSNGFAVSATTNPGKLALKILVGDQVVAFSIPKNRLEKLGQSLIDASREFGKA